MKTPKEYIVRCEKCGRERKTDHEPKFPVELCRDCEDALIIDIKRMKGTLKAHQ